VDDLSAGKLDAVVMDRRPAENFVRQGKAKLVGHGLKPQAFAIAVRKGSPLLPDLNRALGEMQTDGTTAKLIETYLQAPASAAAAGPLPVAKALSAATASPAPDSCIDGMAWVANLQTDDQDMSTSPVMQPGQAFTKSWRLRNTGTCDWSPDFTLIYRMGNAPAAQMGGKAFKVGQVVPPGETADVSVDLVAPTAPGVYQGFWQITDATGTPFGERIWVGVRVP
jgi:hypothetical protein